MKNLCVLLSLFVCGISQAAGYQVHRSNVAPDVQGTALSAACKTKLGDAIQSVYPNAALSGVMRWHCERTHKDPVTPNEWSCKGVYVRTVSIDDWYTLRQSYPHLPKPTMDGQNVVLHITTDPVILDASEKTAHGPFIACLGVTAANLFWFDAQRDGVDESEVPIVRVRFAYKETEATKADVAALDVAGTLVEILEP